MYRQTSWSSDDDANVLLSAFVERIEKQLKLLRRLATEHWQQLLVRSERRLLCDDVVTFLCTDNSVGIKLTDKSGELDVQCLQQEHVVRLNDVRVRQLFVIVLNKKRIWSSHFTQQELRKEMEEIYCNESSAVAEMGYRLAMGRKVGAAVWGAGSPSNTMSPGPRPTSVPVTSWSIQPFGHNTPTLQTGQTKSSTDAPVIVHNNTSVWVR